MSAPAAPADAGLPPPAPRPAPSPAPAPEPVERGTSLWRDAWRRLRRNRFALAGAIYLTLVVVACLLGPGLTWKDADGQSRSLLRLHPFSPTEQSLSLGATPPLAPLAEQQDLTTERPPQVLSLDRIRLSDDISPVRVRDGRRPRPITPAEKTAILDGLAAGREVRVADTAFRPQPRRHLLGTDQHGRDLLARMLDGGRISLGVGVLATLVSVLIGVLYGSIAGYAGGTVDTVLMRIVDILWALPFTIFVIILMVIFGRDIWLLFLAIGAVEWLTMARIVRAQILTLKKMEFVEAAHALGLSNARIVLRHLIPNVLGPVIVFSTLTVPAVMLLESALSFLGLGVQPPHASWGVLIKEGTEAIQVYPWLLVSPALLFSITLLALNFLGDGLRDALDVRASKD